MIHPTTQYCSFSDVFHFAEKVFKVSWNDCCDLFHREQILNYKGYNFLELEEVEAGIEYSEQPKHKKAHEILTAFMKTHALDKILVLGDSGA